MVFGNSIKCLIVFVVVEFWSNMIVKGGNDGVWFVLDISVLWKL